MSYMVLASCHPHEIQDGCNLLMDKGERRRAQLRKAQQTVRDRRNSRLEELQCKLAETEAKVAELEAVAAAALTRQPASNPVADALSVLVWSHTSDATITDETAFMDSALVICRSSVMLRLALHDVNGFMNAFRFVPQTYWSEIVTAMSARVANEDYPNRLIPAFPKLELNIPETTCFLSDMWNLLLSSPTKAFLNIGLFFRHLVDTSYVTHQGPGIDLADLICALDSASMCAAMTVTVAG